jgi:hypothetical protein
MVKIKEKATNYSAGQIDLLREMYTGADNAGEVEAISKATGKTPASVRAKLASLGLYKSKESAAVAGDKVTKIAIVDKIGDVVGLAEHEREGLTKATKAALEKILAKLA